MALDLQSLINNLFLTVQMLRWAYLAADLILVLLGMQEVKHPEWY